MIAKDTRDLLVALDIGTSKVVAMVAELESDGQFNVNDPHNAPQVSHPWQGIQ